MSDVTYNDAYLQKKMDKAMNLKVNCWEGGELLQTETRNQLKRMSNGASKPFTMSNGSQVYPEEEIELFKHRNGSAYVRVNPQGVMKWWEKGTNPRTTRAGRSTGQIEAEWYFRNAQRTTAPMIFRKVEESVNKEIQKINNI